MRKATVWALTASLIFSITACSGGGGKTALVPQQPGNAALAGHSGTTALLSTVGIEKELGAAGPEFWAVLGLGSPTDVSITGPSSVRGAHNVGVAGASKFSMSDGFISQQLVIGSATTTNISGPAVVKGGIVVNDGALNAAVAAADAATTFFAGLPASPGTPTNINITNPSGDVTIMATTRTTVIDLQDLILNGGSTLTLAAPNQTWQFIINVSGTVAIQGGSKVLTQGIDPPHVILNVVGPGHDVALGGGTQNGHPNSWVYAIILATQRNIALSPGLVRPEVIGGGQQITITSGGEVFDHDF